MHCALLELDGRFTHVPPTLEHAVVQSSPAAESCHCTVLSVVPHCASTCRRRVHVAPPRHDVGAMLTPSLLPSTTMLAALPVESQSVQ